MSQPRADVSALLPNFALLSLLTPFYKPSSSKQAAVSYHLPTWCTEAEKAFPERIWGLGGRRSKPDHGSLRVSTSHKIQERS